MGKICIDTKINRRLNPCLFQTNPLQGNKYWLFGNFNSINLLFDNIILMDKQCVILLRAIPASNDPLGQRCIVVTMIAV